MKFASRIANYASCRSLHLPIVLLLFLGTIAVVSAERRIDTPSADTERQIHLDSATDAGVDTINGKVNETGARVRTLRFPNKKTIELKHTKTIGAISGQRYKNAKQLIVETDRDANLSRNAKYALLCENISEFVAPEKSMQSNDVEQVKNTHSFSLLDSAGQQLWTFKIDKGSEGKAYMSDSNNVVAILMICNPEANNCFMDPNDPPTKLYVLDKKGNSYLFVPST